MANLVAEVGIVVTGGIVRLTGSGLGCSTWPECQPGSFTPIRTAESQYHDLIEFGNRTLTCVVVLLAVASLWVVLRVWPERRRMHYVAYGVLAGIVAQAVVGGITVLTGLNPWTVMFHFLLSMVLIALSTALVRGAADEESGPGELTVHPIARRRRLGDGRRRRRGSHARHHRHRLGSALRRCRDTGTNGLRPALRVVDARGCRHALRRARHRDARRGAAHGP